jgi:hypothetical protein
LRQYALIRIDPIRHSDCAVPLPEMVATCVPTTSTASWPDPMNQRAVYDGVGFIGTSRRKRSGTATPAAPSWPKEFVTAMPTPRGAAQAIIDATAFAKNLRTSRSRRPSRRQLSQPA